MKPMFIELTEHQWDESEPKTLINVNHIVYVRKHDVTYAQVKRGESHYTGLTLVGLISGAHSEVKVRESYDDVCRFIITSIDNNYT